MAERLKVGGSLLRETLAVLRTCGAGRRECVAYWTGPLEEPGLVDRLLHPEHLGFSDFYEISSAWLNETWRTLARERRAIRVQIHTHGRRAFHSSTDDRYPIVYSAGLLSLVLPRFAAPPQTLEDAFLARLEPNGTWAELDPQQTLERLGS